MSNFTKEPKIGIIFERIGLEYETKDGWLTEKARILVYLQRRKRDNVIAISAGSTHLGCIVTWHENQ